MSLRFLFDTSVISAPIAKSPDAKLVGRIEDHAHEAAIASTVWHELIYGVSRLPRGRRRDALMDYVETVVGVTFPILPYDDKAAAWHARERARLEKAGKPVPFADGQIASIAYANDLVLVTHNTKDFARYQNMRLENWTGRR